MDLLLNESAQAILDRARRNAARNDAPVIRPEHLLLALLAEEDGLAADFVRWGVGIERVRTHLEALVANEDPPSDVLCPPLSEEAMDVMEQASRDAWADARNRVCPRHILLALVNCPWGRAASILAECKLDMAALRDRLHPPRRGRSAPDSPKADPSEPILAMWLDDGVLALLTAAMQEAASQDYRRVQPQHLLMGLLALDDGVAAQVCRAIELDPLDLRDEAAHWIASDAEGQLVNGVRVSPPVVDILQSAQEAALQRGTLRVSCGDVFSAMLRSGDTFFPTILERFHVPPREIQHELLDLAGADYDALLQETATLSGEAGRQFTHDAELDRALARARDQASTSCADHVGTEHLLLALVLDTRSTASRALQACGVDLVRAREAIEPATWGRSAPQDDLPLTPRAERAMHVARLEARHLDHPRVGTGHLLLALYWQRKGAASRLLQGLEVVPSRLRKEVLAATSDGEDAEVRVFPPLTTRARAVLRHAARLVTGPTWPAVNRGHLLQALLHQQGGTARSVLETLMVSRHMLAAKAERWAKETEAAERPRAFTASVWGILGTAWAEAERHGLGHVGTGHLLYGVAAHRTGRIAALFGMDSLDPEGIRARLRGLLELNP